MTDAPRTGFAWDKPLSGLGRAVVPQSSQEKVLGACLEIPQSAAADVSRRVLSGRCHDIGADLRRRLRFFKLALRNWLAGCPEEVTIEVGFRAAVAVIPMKGTILANQSQPERSSRCWIDVRQE